MTIPAKDLLNYDFCPWANRYLYWLKEPVGWFVLATMASIVVGIFFSPIGWSVAVGLVAIVSVGLGFPWLAVRSVRCSIEPVQESVHERESAELELSIRNFLPLPIIGLLVEGYLTHRSISDSAEAQLPTPEFGLARVPAFCTAKFRLPITPEYRGYYPADTPRMSCAFPFGIWTARKSISASRGVTVFPLIIPISEEVEFTGRQISDAGSGNRIAAQGDFLGVRDFRRGDSLKSIHWAQSARNDRLIVCERGGPQQQAVSIYLSTINSQGDLLERRENLAWRVRVAASLIDLLVARHAPFRLMIDGQYLPVPDGAAAREAAWRRLADIPLDSVSKLESDEYFCSLRQDSPRSTNWIAISAIDSESGTNVDPRWVCLELGRSTHDHVGAFKQSLDLDRDIVMQLNSWLQEASRERSFV